MSNSEESSNEISPVHDSCDSPTPVRRRVVRRSRARPVWNVPLDAYGMCELLDRYARDWSTLCIKVVGKYVHNLDKKISKILQASPPLYERSKTRIRKGVEGALGSLEGFYNKILFIETILIPTELAHFTIFRDLLKNAQPPPCLPFVQRPLLIENLPINIFENGEFIDCDPLEWHDFFVNNVDINADEICELLYGYAEDGLGLSLSMGKYVTKVSCSKIWEHLKECSGFDEQSKKMILVGVENAVSKIEAVNVEILDIKTRFIPEQLNQFTAFRDRLRNEAAQAPAGHPS